MFHVACVLLFHLRYWPGMVAMQSIATTTDDLGNREINAAEIHGVHLNGLIEAAQIPELK